MNHLKKINKRFLKPVAEAFVLALGIEALDLAFGLAEAIGLALAFGLEGLGLALEFGLEGLGLALEFGLEGLGLAELEILKIIKQEIKTKIETNKRSSLKTLSGSRDRWGTTLKFLKQFRIF